MSGKSSRAVLARRSFVLVPCVVAGCTIVQPVPPVTGGDALSHRVPDNATEAEIRALACKRPDDAPNFSGKLDVAICEADKLRLEYRIRSGEVVNVTAAYNAALWPFIATSIYRLRGGETGRALVPALLFGTAQGILGSGGAESQQDYSAAADKLTCAITHATTDLIPVRQVPAGEGGPALELGKLQLDLASLDIQLRNYESLVAAFQNSLKPRPGRPADESLPFTARMHGRGGAVAGADSRGTATEEADALAQRARRVLDRGNRLNERLTGGHAHTDLQAARDEIRAAVTAKFGKRIAPADPVTVATSFSNAQNALRAQSGESVTGQTYLFSKNAFSGLDAQSSAWLGNVQHYNAKLWGTMRDVTNWADTYDARRAEFQKLLAKNGCVVPLPATPPPPAAAAQSGRAATDNTGGGQRPLASRP